MEWQTNIFIDTCLPFGLRTAPKLSNILADPLSWITMQRGGTCSIHYLDDFLMMGPPRSTICQENRYIFKHTCKEFGVPLATEKVEGPSTCLTFLGVVLDTAKSEIRLPEEKLLSIHLELSIWLGKKRATKL